jgi:hypothetical protein
MASLLYWAGLNEKDMVHLCIYSEQERSYLLDY